MTDQSRKDDQADGRVEQKMRFNHDTLPGQRDSLAEGALGGTRTGAQGDENRDPPANAPAIPGIGSAKG
jgi:hypothetical protein